MRSSIVFAACILQIILTVYGEGQYTVVGPGVIHSGGKYNVAVGAYNTKVLSKIKVGITGLSYNNSKLVTLQPDEIATVQFDLPELAYGNYSLTAEGIEGLIFKNDTKLSHSKHETFVKLQTDKGIYKPSDVVNFRVIFLNENLQPGSPTKTATITVEDPDRNRIKVFKDIETVKGVHTAKFEIAEFPTLGNWQLIVQNGEQSYAQASFEVAKYVAPKYSIKVESTERVSVKDGDMHVIVRSNYTYGKPVNGKATLLINLQYFSSKEKSNPPTLIKIKDLVNGKAKFDLNVKEYQPYLRDSKYASTLSITATVEENFTGVKINSSTYTSLFPNRYSMSCVEYGKCYKFTPGQEEEQLFQLTYIDNTPLNDTKSVVKLIYTEKIEAYPWEQEKKLPAIENKHAEFESHMNGTGFVTFKVTLPDLTNIVRTDNDHLSHYYQMQLQYADEKEDILSVYKYVEPKQPQTKAWEEPKDYFKVHIQHKPKQYKWTVGEENIVTINSSVPLSYFVYNLVSRGDIMKSERVVLPEKPHVYNITITPTHLMAPYTKFYAYYVDELGDLHYGGDRFYIDVEFQNQLEITAPEKVKPGEEVALKIKTEPQSFVGLLAVDQSVLLLRQNHDIGEYDVKYLLGRHDTYTPWQGGYSEYPGESAGVITMTNANYFYNYTSPFADNAPVSIHSQNKVGVMDIESVAKPMSAFGALAGPGGPGGGGGANGAGGVITVRKNFEETWFFANIENTELEEFTWVKKIPDTITSWVIKGFSLNPNKGIGFAKHDTKVTTFQPFFIAVRLPYSVQREEVINVPALVFNYLQKDLDVEITLENTDNEFDFTEVSNNVLNEPKQTKSLRVPAESSKGVSFMIRPKVIGTILLKFKAISPIAGDAIHKPLKVVPEGVTQYANRAYFVNLKNTSEYKDLFELQLPENVVPDSQHIEFSVIGDLIGPVFTNIHGLVRMPVGCGEQVTSSLLPNYLLLRYLKNINKSLPGLQSTLKHNLERGYQNILNYRNLDGSFSSFRRLKADTDQPTPSIWLTAYVMRSLHQISEYITVDNKIIESGLNFIASKQAENGSFVEVGDWFYLRQKIPISLTASVLLTFIENKNLSANYQSNIDKGFKFILDNSEKADSLFLKAYVAYTLHKNKHPRAVDELANLKKLAKTENDRKWWSERQESGHDWWRWSYSSDVETTSYILLILLDMETEPIDNVLPIIRWLIAQRNSYGGFSSTQDTVVGLQAIIKFAEKYKYEVGLMDVSLNSKGVKNKQETIKVNEENAELMQTVELPQKTTAVEFSAKGKGVALVQISYQYNVKEKEKKPSFTINTLVNPDTPPHKLAIDICVEYTGDQQSSNMAVLEVSLPSGYTVDEDNFEHIREIDRVRNIEVKNAQSVVMIYFESLVKGDVKCLPIEAYKTFAVALQKPVPIVLYDYYDTSKKATNYYEVSSKLCDICEDDESCHKACK